MNAAVLGTGPDKDCRGCHDYSKGARDAHLAGCERCHQDTVRGGAHLSVSMTGAASRSAFPHEEHLSGDKASGQSISCFTCHALRDRDWMDFEVPTAGLRRGAESSTFGAKSCADCHAEHGSKVTKQWRARGEGACRTCHLAADPIRPVGAAAPAGLERPFLHRDHVAPSGDCKACHEPIVRSRSIWDYDPAKGTAERCKDCHVDERGQSLVGVSTRTTAITRIAFGNFPHDMHGGDSSNMTCATCHYPETDERGRRVFTLRAASPEPVGRAQLVRYAACDACHGFEGWAPRRPSWHVEGHGVGPWACFKCHDSSGSFGIATASVTRADIGNVGFVAHAHPAVTKSGAPLRDPTQSVANETKACTDCHIGAGADLASRLAGKPFAHGPHLPAKPTTADCLQCHSSSAVSNRSEDLQRFDPHVAGAPPPVGATADAKSCLVCHAGATAAQLGLDVAPAPRKVVQFDHANHVRAASLVPGETGIGCAECHQPGGPAGYTTPADVLTCAKCHGHSGDPAKVARTGTKGVAGGDQAKCRNCHDEFSAAASTKPRETVTRSHLALTEGRQFHDKSGDCAVCHSRDGRQRVAYEDRIASAATGVSIHEDVAFRDRPFNKPSGKPFKDLACECRECHRTEPRGYLKVLR